MSLLVLCAKFVAPRITKKELRILPVDLYECLRKYMEKDKQIKLFSKIIMWHENGQKQYEHNYKDGNRHGLSVGWYNNGQKSYEHNYKDGNLHGLSVGWHKNGQIWYEHNLA